MPLETPRIVWTLHHNVFSRERPVLAVRRRILSGDTWLCFALGRASVAFVSREELSLRGSARSCRGPGPGSFHPLLEVYDHPPSPEERRAFLARRAREQAAMRASPPPVWLVVPGAPREPFRALRCATRAAPRERSGPGTSRFDLELGLPFRGFRDAPVVSLLDVVGRGMATFVFRRSRFVVSLDEPSIELLAQSAAELRGQPREEWLREDAEALIGAPCTTRITRGEEAIVELGLELPCTAEEVRRAFRRRVVVERAHPDQGGSGEAFRELLRLRDLALHHVEPKALPARSAA